MSLFSVFQKKIHAQARPIPIRGAHNYVLIILDSCRFDSFVQAKPTFMNKSLEHYKDDGAMHLGQHQHTIISCLDFFHMTTQPMLLQAQYTKKSYFNLLDRLNIPNIQFEHMLPRMWLPQYLQSLGYYTQAIVSMPVINPSTPIAVDFDEYTLLKKHNNLRGAFRFMKFFHNAPHFA